MQLLSTADILREPASQGILTNVRERDVKENGTDRLLTVSELNALGKYTDAVTILALVKDRLKTFGGAPMVSDSYPRSVAQLADAREKLDLEFAGIFYMRASSPEVYWKIFERRREARKYCPRPDCNTFFDPVTNPTNGNCPRDGTELIRRKDDEPEVAKKRYESYLKNAAPMVEVLRGKENFFEISVDNSNGRELLPAEVFEKISQKLSEILKTAEIPEHARTAALGNFISFSPQQKIG